MPQPTIEEEGRTRDLCTEAEGRHRLKDVAGADVFLDRVDRRKKILRCLSIPRHKVNGGAALRGRRSRRREWCGKACAHGREALRNRVVELRRIVALPNIGEVVQLCGVSQSVVNDEIAAHHELTEQLLAVQMHAAHTVKRRCRLVCEIARKPAVDKGK